MKQQYKEFLEEASKAHEKGFYLTEPHRSALFLLWCCEGERSRKMVMDYLKRAMLQGEASQKNVDLRIDALTPHEMFSRTLSDLCNSRLQRYGYETYRMNAAARI